MLLTSLESIPSPPLKDEDWIMAFVDRTCRPETEVWIFGSWESVTTALSSHRAGNCDSLVMTLVKAIKHLGPLPKSIHQSLLDATDAETNQKDVSGVSRKDYSAHILDPNIILCGAVHESTTKILEKLGLIKTVFDAGLVPNHTYVFDVTELPEPRDLPNGLRWGELKYENFATVRARTQIPRQDKTLADLPNLAIYDVEKGVPIAWVFVGIDASLTTLHVEEEWRGKGLAKMIALKLWREKMNKFWEHGVPNLTHDYVIRGNAASVATSESLGGKHIGDTFWVRLDMSLAG
ncbi:uncharacterized protein MYCFIDRAFT_37556 [Pseudocercospora fijiensis CIRAD86]|uniref:FR47-like domain-containing protein n=1 Tax=Pseudocercospora fijiensis (strain CIRAD86) TaxID=383855 RepID=M3A4T6_PSEFD|nr:uncharacterized protein MYCFIDRAFT_37556 [Pseudocercospora fijiensis CIRAD86]EME79621.1 hypothetical protein MYCFIDRAFT_37556 [Pseudocercospora fijiensis CIRAD86]